MNSIIGRALTIWCSLLLGAGGQAAVPDQVVWKDQEGDVQGASNLPNRPTPDLSKVTIGSGAGYLTIELDMKNLQKRLAYQGPDGKRHAASLVDLLLDTDNNPGTGGAPLSLWRGEQKPARFGFELRIAVLAGFRFQSTDGGSGRSTGDVAIDSTGKSKIEPIVAYQIWSLGAQRFGSKHVAISDADKERMDAELAKLEADRVRLKIPYGYLGVKSGGRIRIAYLDVQESSTRESALSTDQTLLLK